MKSPEEYLDYYFDFADVRKSDLIQMINEIKKDSYNKAIENILNHDDIDLYHCNGDILSKEFKNSLKLL